MGTLAFRLGFQRSPSDELNYLGASLGESLLGAFESQ
jgi:hypothetical protein